MAGRPSCIKCVSYFVTHDSVNPHGCRFLGFKSKQNPATLVFSSSGIECQFFKSKNKVKPGGSGTGGSRGGLVA